jgi:redox-sensitive bicupin YhaK (pirin superfamily)
MTIEIRRSDERASTQIGWLDSHHSFSFGQHYDPHNTHFGLLLVSNDDVVKAGTGFETHPHRDMEIVTWVLDGSLVHQDSHGHNGVIYPGLAQRMSAGTGILHSEKNDAWTLTGDPEHADDVHFIQMWVVPDTASITPGYDQLDINDALASGGLVPVASGRARHEAAIRIQQKHAALHAARLAEGSDVTLPDAPYVHLFAAKGAIDLEGGGRLETGDAARITSAGAARVTAVDGDAEILVWEMDGTLR